MRIFGRKANSSSATPTAPDVPPELRPYYDGQTRRARALHRLRQLSPLIIAVVLGAVIIGGAFWLRAHHMTPNNQTAENNAQISPGPTQSDQQQNKNNAQNNAAGSNSTPAVPNTLNNGTSAAPQNQPPATSASPTTSQQTAAIPNTGPGASAVLIALGAGATAMLASYARQLRRQADR